ncbi:DUF3703 domain-containing protein [Nonomuraea sp. B19D2]|uniref:DUF3703 domain-containing protein n=1 Tax=Nonomuraea sp. B19D2 TaxID=3159561 RepID=UPI0032DA1F7D
MPARVRAAYRSEMRAARTATSDDARWRHLERAHVISQRFENGEYGVAARLGLRVVIDLTRRRGATVTGSGSAVLRPAPRGEGGAGAGRDRRCWRHRRSWPGAVSG